MNPAFVPVACGSALALMAGAVASHWVSVRQTAALVDVLHPTPSSPERATLPPEDESIREAKSLIAAAKAVPSAADSPSSPADARFEQLLSSIEGLVTLNQELRSQLEETNRDLVTLQFQVDTHSESFRPLNVVDEAPMTMMADDGPGVLPARQTP